MFVAGLLTAGALVGCGSEIGGAPPGETTPSAADGTEPEDVLAPGDEAADAGSASRDAGTTSSSTDAGTGNLGADGGGVADAGGGGSDAGAGAGADAGAGLPRMNGTCTVTNRPKRLSCPTGMSCYCYESPYSAAKDAPSFLEVRTSPTSLEVVSGQIPPNLYLGGPPPAVIPLVASPTGATGAAGGYVVTVANGVTTVKLESTAGYQPEKYLKYSSADCGSNGQTVRCTFETP